MSHSQSRPAEPARVVAQVFNLLYRRFAIGRVLANSRAPAIRQTPAGCNPAIRQIENLRYGYEISGFVVLRRLTVLILALGWIGLSLRGDEKDWFVPLGQPPQAAPRRISGGEGMPPLPLPATPLRRTERKREPSPPKLMAKMVWGETASFTYDNGTSTQVSDWNLCPADLQQLLRKASGGLGVPYGSDVINLGSLDPDPAKMPVLLFSGSRTIKFSRKEMDLLRAYVLRGGMVMGDNIAGSPYFYNSFRKAMEETFPELGVRTIPPDHPVFHILYDIDEVKYPKNLNSKQPFLEGMYVFSRIGVLISKYGLGCGWDDHEVPLLEKAVYYDVPSANKIGMNLIAYAVGYANVGREEAKPELFGTLDEKPPTDEFVFAQIKHGGAWNVHAGGSVALLRRLRQNTSLRVNLKRVTVEPGKGDLASCTFLYLTGLDDFHWDANAVSALRGFLTGGGALLINNGLGLRTFDQAVRRELRAILPETELKPVPLNHPIYNSVFKISEVQYSPVLQRQQPNLCTPTLEGIVLNGDLKVIYSPVDLEAGWEGIEHPLAKGYERNSAMQLGINIVMYAMTH